MSKNLSISLIFLAAVLLLGTAFLMSEKKVEEDTGLSRINVTITTGVIQEEVDESGKLSLTEALKYVDKKTLKGDQLIRYALASLPFCGTPNLYRTPQVISDNVQNCRRKAKKGSFPDGLGGVFLNNYTYDTNSHSAVSIIESFSLDESGDIQVDGHKAVCLSFINGFPEVAYTFVKDGTFLDKMAESFFNYSGAAYALEKGLSKEHIRRVDYAYDDGMLYINPNDEDLPINYGAGAWSDGSGNYFIAGYNWENKLVYQINDILFDPGEGNGHKDNLFDEKDNKWESRWYFGGFRDGKAIVNRFLEYHYLGTTVSLGSECVDGNCWDKKKNASEFILESCELDLDTFNLNY